MFPAPQHSGRALSALLSSDLCYSSTAILCVTLPMCVPVRIGLSMWTIRPDIICPDFMIPQESQEDEKLPALNLLICLVARYSI